jgi:hypothetical protein
MIAGRSLAEAPLISSCAVLRCATASREALAAVAPHIARLEEVINCKEWLKSMDNMMLSAGPGFEREAADTTQQGLRAVGEHIHGAEWSHWVDGAATPAMLWHFVSVATRIYGMDGGQLARLYAGLKRKHGWQQVPGT